jgi:hypothetical protein
MASALGSGIICREKYRPDAREKREYLVIIYGEERLQGENEK